MKDVQCYELFGGIALKNHAFSLFLLSNVYSGKSIQAQITGAKFNVVFFFLFRLLVMLFNVCLLNY